MLKKFELSSTLLPPMDGEMFVRTLTDLAKAACNCADDPEAAECASRDAVIELLESLGLKEHAHQFAVAQGLRPL